MQYYPMQKGQRLLKTAEAVYQIIKSKYNVISHINMHINGIKYTSEDYVLRNAELIIVLGGDGTILRTARKVCKRKNSNSRHKYGQSRIFGGN
ncbi:MAG: hypothetical protein L6V93_10765 [Clostridiales bacterium]|nr:MAG: hypothetical protein L6V93_10765 [Clostridiales bacterium]